MFKGKNRNDPSVLRDRVLKLIIFDFDGTLVDSRSLILESHQIVFSEFQLPAPSPVDSLALVGKSLDIILTQLAGPTAPIPEMVRAYDLLLPQLRADPAFAEKPFDGGGDLLHELSSTSDTILGVATGHRSDTIAPAPSRIPRCSFRHLRRQALHPGMRSSLAIPPLTWRWLRQHSCDRSASAGDIIRRSD